DGDQTYFTGLLLQIDWIHKKHLYLTWQLCLRRWSSCKDSQMTLGTQTWKQYYLCRSELEFRMESGRPEKDFICKAIAGHKGEIDELAYISTNEYRFDGQEKSVVCTVSSDGTVRAWDLQEVSPGRDLPRAVDRGHPWAGLGLGALAQEDLKARQFYSFQNRGLTWNRKSFGAGVSRLFL
ncbi:F-box/WD repeat-containing protein 12-like, partial [Pteropus vampyrus]|uniref:F-box/WD repeat-containing protein 12-like n=1 Tax=Pteropus vampyrus TaxID=132908 RepID=A0A6P3RQ77_PTEVA